MCAYFYVIKHNVMSYNCTFSVHSYSHRIKKLNPALFASYQSTVLFFTNMYFSENQNFNKGDCMFCQNDMLHKSNYTEHPLTVHINESVWKAIRNSPVYKVDFDTWKSVKNVGPIDMNEQCSYRIINTHSQQRNAMNNIKIVARTDILLCYVIFLITHR